METQTIDIIMETQTIDIISTTHTEESINDLTLDNKIKSTSMLIKKTLYSLYLDDDLENDVMYSFMYNTFTRLLNNIDKITYSELDDDSQREYKYYLITSIPIVIKDISKLSASLCMLSMGAYSIGVDLYDGDVTDLMIDDEICGSSKIYNMDDYKNINNDSLNFSIKNNINKYIKLCDISKDHFLTNNFLNDYIYKYCLKYFNLVYYDVCINSFLTNLYLTTLNIAKNIDYVYNTKLIKTIQNIK